MVRLVRVASPLTLGLALWFLSGCGSSGGGAATGGDKVERAQSIALSQVGDLLRVRAEEGSKPPTKAADLAKYEKAFPVGYPKVKSGEIVLFLDTPLDEAASDKVLAYEKQVPESGGLVLMQDGKTTQKMTADEFKAAPKAGTNASAPVSGKAK
ncbi:MAG: hypothetical protein P4L84_19005 [Isosphaeraceae bacterium]|nr:hypothetical protein [Isosphaeraceae bacterium]